MLIRRAKRLGKHIIVTGILGNWVIKGPHIIKLLFDRAKLLAQKPKRKSKRKDFGHFVLSLPEKPMKKGAFDTAAKKFKMKMVDNDLLTEIIKHFPYKKKKIDCVALKEKYLELYPDTQPPPPKKKKGKKGKKNKISGDAVPETLTPETPKWPSVTRSATIATDKKVSVHESITKVRIPSTMMPPMPRGTDPDVAQHLVDANVLEESEANKINIDFEIDGIDDSRVVSRTESNTSSINVDHKSHEFIVNLEDEQNVVRKLPTVEEGIEPAPDGNI